MIVCFLIYGVLTVLFMVSASEKSSKKGIQKIFDRMGQYAVRKFMEKGGRGTALYTRTEEEFSMLQPAADSSTAVSEEMVKLIAMGLLILFIGTTFSLFLGVKGLGESVLPDGVYLDRGTYGEGSREETLKVKEEGGKKERKVTVPVEERKYTQEETEELFRKAEEKLQIIVPGNNKTLNEVKQDLKLPKEISGLPINITWQCDNYEVMDDTGRLTGKGTDEKGVTVNLNARLSYFEKSKVISFEARVYPAELSATEKWMKKLKGLIVRQDKQTETKEQLRLPDKMDGRKLGWSREDDSSFGGVLILTLATAVLIPSGKWKERKSRLQERKRQMLTDYPDVVNKLVLFLGAGMTVGGAFRRLTEEYEQRKKASGAIRYAYEEMAVTIRELESGTAEGKAYEEFGRRCRIQEYLKLGTLLSQNLKKGTKDLTNMLELEAKEAFEDRKRLAKKQGEEAGTKMLVPMVMMLAVVLMIVIVPAFSSFGI